VHACELAYNHLLKKGDEKAAGDWRQRALDHIELDRKMEAERDQLPLNVELSEPEISEELSRELTRACSHYTDRRVAAAKTGQTRREE